MKFSTGEDVCSTLVARATYVHDLTKIVCVGLSEDHGYIYDTPGTNKKLRSFLSQGISSPTIMLSFIASPKKKEEKRRGNK